MFLLSYLLSADVSACAVHFRFHGHYEEETKVRETNDIFMRKNREASYWKEKNEKIFWKRTINNKNVQISKQSNGMYNKTEDIELKRISKIEQMISLSVR